MSWYYEYECVLETDIGMVMSSSDCHVVDGVEIYMFGDVEVVVVADEDGDVHRVGPVILKPGFDAHVFDGDQERAISDDEARAAVVRAFLDDARGNVREMVVEDVRYKIEMAGCYGDYC